MELSLRLDTLGMVEMRYLRSRDRYRDWPSFQLLAASRQAKVMAYLSRDVAEQLHQQILLVESAVGFDEDEDEQELIEEDEEGEREKRNRDNKTNKRDNGHFPLALVPALAQC